MTITTYDDAIAKLRRPISFIKGTTSGSVDGAAAFMQTLWNYGVYPPAGSLDSTLNGVALTAPITGALPFANPTSGNTYLSRLTGAICNGSADSNAPCPGVLMLCDRLWHNGGFNNAITTAQSITTPTWPARDIAGSTNGAGVFLALECSAGTNIDPGAFTVSYTNSAGTAGRTGTNYEGSHGSSQRQQAWDVGLQTGDLGVRSVESLSFGSTQAGTWNLVAYRPIAHLEIRDLSKKFEINPMSGGFPRIYDGSVLYFMYRCGNAKSGGNPTPLVIGQVEFAQG